MARAKDALFQFLPINQIQLLVFLFFGLQLFEFVELELSDQFISLKKRFIIPTHLQLKIPFIGRTYRLDTVATFVVGRFCGLLGLFCARVFILEDVPELANIILEMNNRIYYLCAQKFLSHLPVIQENFLCLLKFLEIIIQYTHHCGFFIHGFVILNFLHELLFHLLFQSCKCVLLQELETKPLFRIQQLFFLTMFMLFNRSFK